MTASKPTPAPRGARGKVLLATAIAVVAALGYLAWSAQKPRAPVTAVQPPAPASQPDRSSGPASRPALDLRPRTPRQQKRAPVVAPAPIDGGEPRAGLTRVHVREAQAQLHRAADGCVAEALKSNPNLGLRMAMRYTLYVQGGEARAVNPRITKNLINDPQVEKCILAKVVGARWPVEASDGILHVAESFNFKHLVRMHISD